MAYLFPPMAEEPPSDYVDFVAGHLTALRRDAARLTDGDPYANQLPGEVLADVAGHWRRLRWWSRLRRGDAAADFLSRRLVARAKQWREDRPYPVDVRSVPSDARRPAAASIPATGAASCLAAARPVSVAQGLAPLLGSTIRVTGRAVAEAEIAWVHAYQRYCWRRVGRVAAAVVLIVGGIVQIMSHLSAPIP
ncbi:hypothetical protein EV385_0743 [Krasilnikovia cinnamomea]|uniref:Uncharacterized protein n=1 Tax=Krasilnikovia cinnamomea TaxID=349313 RepID=A0A4Q7ZG64_9ACTN|nr:hypothetical protein [Krasilnikovia cinnamomea]RZU49009.1 hypothetical protein EV385_0743 [Krasilnikovia cinnamomea]